MTQRIKELRLKANMTLLELANKLGVSEGTVQRYETGNIKNLKYDTIVNLANIFGCTPAYLMGWDEDPNNGQNEGYYFNEEAAELAREVCEDPELRFVLKAKRDLSKDDFNVIVDMIRALKAKEGK